MADFRTRERKPAPAPRSGLSVSSRARIMICPSLPSLCGPPRIWPGARRRRSSASVAGRWAQPAPAQAAHQPGRRPGRRIGRRPAQLAAAPHRAGTRQSRRVVDLAGVDVAQRVVDRLRIDRARRTARRRRRLALHAYAAPVRRRPVAQCSLPGPARAAPPCQTAPAPSRRTRRSASASPACPPTTGSAPSQR